MYDPAFCQKALEAEFVHADTVIATDNNPDGDSYMAKLPFCECHHCRPDLWPKNIQEQLDEFMENNGPGTIPVD